MNGLVISERLLIEPLLVSHAEHLFDALADERIYRWVSAMPPPNRESLERRWEAVLSGARTPPGQLGLNWALRRKTDGHYVGKFDVLIGANQIATNVGYIVFFQFWNQGYATEAVRAVAAHLETHGIVEQRALVTVGNAASSRVLLKSGFAKTRIIPNNDVIRGVPHDDEEYVRGRALTT